MSQPIRVWEYEGAPKDLRELTALKGNWIAEIPPTWVDKLPAWLSVLGRNIVMRQHPNKPSWRVRIWSDS